MTYNIPCPPWNGLGRKLESLMRRALLEFEMVHEAKKVAVALSGGKDSIALLAMLKAVSGRGFPPFELMAIHISGEASCGAGVGSGFLQSMCDGLGVPLIQRSSKHTLEGLECYSCSRERRSLIFQAAKEHDCTIIAFGHHEDDNAQTVLMNLFHKGEFAPLLPKISMVDYGITIIRPFIYVEERMLIEFAKLQGFHRITCQCPVGQVSKRKKTKELLEEIQEHFPHARHNIAEAALTHGSRKALRLPWRCLQNSVGDKI